MYENTDELIFGRYSKPISEEESNGFRRFKPSFPDMLPIIRYKDLNNQIESDLNSCNPEHNAIEVGIRVSF